MDEQSEGCTCGRSKSLVIQIVRPVPGLLPRWVGAVLFVDRKVACNNVPDAEIRAILAHPESYRIVEADELTSASALLSGDSGSFRPERRKRPSRQHPWPGHLKMEP